MSLKLLLHRSKYAWEPWQQSHCRFQSWVSGTIKTSFSMNWNCKKENSRKTIMNRVWLNRCWQPIYYSNPDQTLLSVSLRWICSSELWCLTSSCLETASQTSLKSSERGKLTSYINISIQNTLTHTLHKTHTSLTHPSIQFLVGTDYKFCCIRYTLPSVRHKLGETTSLWQLTGTAFRGLWTHTYLCTWAPEKNDHKIQSNFGNKMTSAMLCRYQHFTTASTYIQFPPRFLTFM